MESLLDSEGEQLSGRPSTLIYTVLINNIYSARCWCGEENITKTPPLVRAVGHIDFLG